MLARGGRDHRSRIAGEFQITEIGDNACIPLFCPTKQNDLVEARFLDPLTH